MRSAFFLAMVILQQALNALVQGSIYALIALGYTMVYGVLRLINFAHGDVYMLGSFAGVFVATVAMPHGGSASVLQVALVFILAMAISALIGMLIEWLAYRPLRSAPRLTALITAIGVSMLIEYGAQTMFSPDKRHFPPLLPDSLLINTPTFTATFKQATIVVMAFVLMAALQFFVYKTRPGRAMRAISLDRSAASLMGINTDAIISLTFALGSALAAAAGVLNSDFLGSVDPLMGINVGIKAFVAAVLGGIGSIPGAVLGGLIIGLAETAVKATRFSGYSDAISFALLILVLIIRPAGLLGRTQAEKV